MIHKQFKYYCLLLLIHFITLNNDAVAQQTPKKIQFTGAARSIINNNELKGKGEEDTVTTRKTMGGYALIDLGVNIQPNKNTEILGMFRIKNRFGGFYGAGVDFNVRQIFVKGIIANTVRYQLGDINYKLTPFTFYNHDEDVSLPLPEIFNLQREIVNYESFYQKNTWRQQGAALDFALEFSKYIKELKVNGFINRIVPSDFGSNPDRFFAGGNVTLQQSDQFSIGFNYVNLFDILGTAVNNQLLRNEVGSINAEYTLESSIINLQLFSETGKSKALRTNDSLDPKLNDYFIRSGLSFLLKPISTKITFGYAEVGPDFRSAGAQSKRINYSKIPSTYSQYTNQQIFRESGLLDLISDESIYNRSINSVLPSYNPMYNNAMPFGVATFNRKGFFSNLNFEDKRQIVSINASANAMKEIKGQGTLRLKEFRTVNTEIKVNLNKLLNTKKSIVANGNYAFQETVRKGEYDFENTNLSTMQWNAGLEVEVFKCFDILAGIHQLTIAGNEQMPDRNVYSEVIDFNPISLSLKETLTGGGLRYRFSNNIYLAGLFQLYDRNIDNMKNSSYSFQQFLLIYSMKF